MNQKYVHPNQSNNYITNFQKYTPQNYTEQGDKAWIGQLSASKRILQIKVQTPKNYPQKQQNFHEDQELNFISPRQNNQSPIAKISNNNSRASTQKYTQKTPTQLMNDIFRSIGFNNLLNKKAYYSKDSQDLLCELLSNKNKLNAYTKKLSQQMTELPVEVQKNYEILMTLLQQLGQTNMQIHQNENGVKILFNREELLEKQREVEKLQKELEQKNQQTEKIVEEYEAVIRNFNDVIEKLVQDKKH